MNFRSEISTTSTSIQTVFIVLKLTGLINWSWWWVLSPCIITGIAAIIGLLILAAVVIYENHSEV